MKKNILSVLIGVLLGCGELDRPNTNQFVVEGFVTADFQVNDIKIKETVGLADEVIDIPIDDALVRLATAEQEVLLDYNPITQKYEDTSGEFLIEVGQTLDIEIVLDGTVASSTSTVPEKPTGLSLTKTELIVPTLGFNFGLREQIADLFENETSTFSWEGQPGRSYYVVIETQEETIEPILPSQIPEESLELLSSFRFISEPSEATSFEIISIALETYGRHVAKVYSVNEEYVELFNSDTQDSRDLNEPPSNIQNGLGIFSAFAVDSLEFVVRKP